MTTENKSDALRALRAALFREASLRTKQSALAHKIQIASGRVGQIESKIRVLQSQRLSLEFGIADLRADYELIERERFAIRKQRFDVSPEDAQAIYAEIAAARKED